MKTITTRIHVITNNLDNLSKKSHLVKHNIRYYFIKKASVCETNYQFLCALIFHTNANLRNVLKTSWNVKLICKYLLACLNLCNFSFLSLICKGKNMICPRCCWLCESGLSHAKIVENVWEMSEWVKTNQWRYCAKWKWEDKKRIQGNSNKKGLSSQLLST